jgi:hypothetical protein
MLGLLAAAAASLGAEPNPNGWRFNGYYFADGEEWFSLQDPTGGGEWFRKGGAGTVRVLHFDTERAALTVLINSRTHILTLAQGRIAPSGASDEKPDAHAHEPPAAPAGETAPTAPVTPAERFERLKIQALARQIEREESARERAPSFTPAAGESQSGSAEDSAGTTTTRPESSAQATSPHKTLSAEDWLAIHRRTAERRAVLEKKWAAEKLAWASGNSPARDPNPAR